MRARPVARGVAVAKRIAPEDRSDEDDDVADAAHEALAMLRRRSTRGRCGSKT